jgi:acetylglutamate kinase
MKTIVIKLSGAALDDAQVIDDLGRAITQLQQQNTQVVLVHGGGKQLDTWLNKLNFTVEKHNGLRVTPPDQVEVVAAVLSGLLNKQLVAKLAQHQLNTCGLSLLDAGITKAVFHGETKLGNVGLVQASNSDLLKFMLSKKMVPLIASVAACDGHLLNVNADDAAASIAKLIGADRLLLLTDVKGVLDQCGHCIHTLDAKSTQELIDKRVIYGGMVPKVHAALATADQTQCPVTIMSFYDLASLPQLDNQQRGGTTFMPSKNKKNVVTELS